jgi:hypothetical protein
MRSIARLPHRSARHRLPCPAWRGILLAMVLGAVLAHPGQAFYDDSSLRAILFNAERAQEIGAPLVLLAHQTTCNFTGYGPRDFEEHWIWYVGDPKAPESRALRHFEIPVEVKTEIVELERCRIFRGTDTLQVGASPWALVPRADWPKGSEFTQQAVRAGLPELNAGDMVEVVYRLKNRWSGQQAPSAWEVVPIREPGVPTLERHIVVTHNPVLKGRVRVLGDLERPVRHFGVTPPTIELLAGNLPAGPLDGTALGSPRLLFTASLNWKDVRQLLERDVCTAIDAAQVLLQASGDSLGRSHRSTRDRASAVLRAVDRRWEKTPESLTASNYCPTLPSELVTQRVAGALDRAVLVTALARAAHLQAAILLARGEGEPFIQDFQLPQQFDRVLVRIDVPEENAALLIDPQAETLDAALRAASEATLFLGLAKPWEGFYQRDASGSLVHPSAQQP